MEPNNSGLRIISKNREEKRHDQSGRSKGFHPPLQGSRLRHTCRRSSRLRSKDVYEELIGQGKLAFSPNELIHLQKAAENGSLETIVKIKSSIPGARIKEIIPVEKKPEQPQKQS